MDLTGEEVPKLAHLKWEIPLLGCRRSSFSQKTEAREGPPLMILKPSRNMEKWALHALTFSNIPDTCNSWALALKTGSWAVAHLHGKQKAWLRCTLAFLQCCRDRNVIPQFTRDKHCTDTAAVRRLFRRTSILHRVVSASIILSLPWTGYRVCCMSYILS